MLSVVLAGGGTAGHISPMIATGKAVAERVDADLLCIGTPKGIESDVVPTSGLPLTLIDPVPLPRSLNADLVKLPVTLTRSVRQARKVLRDADADVLVGFGGYVSIPAYLAAWTMKVPVVVHEANKLPGIANKVGALFAKFVGITFKETQLRGGQLVGMPMRRSITAPELTREQARTDFGLDPDRRTLLVSGGSQGAVSVNAALIDAREQILEAGVQILHILGPKNFTQADHIVTASSGARYVPIGYVDDMARAYTAADLMLGRAGAGTVMETAVSGVPVIFVPLPWGNGEQGKNATELIDKGAGWLVQEADLDGNMLGALVVDAVSDPVGLEQMAAKCRATYPADAADQMAEAIIEVARKGK